MLKEIVKAFILPSLTKLCLLRYGGVWGMKRVLQKQTKPNSILLQAYDNYFQRNGSWISYKSEFASVPNFPHGPVGVFISGSAVINKNVTIYQQVTIGSNTLNNTTRNGSPIIGENVFIGAGAKIIGGIKVGNNCRIGANAVVYKDMPPNSVAVQAHTRIIQKENLDNRYYSMNKDGKWVFLDNGRWIEDNNKQYDHNSD